MPEAVLALHERKGEGPPEVVVDPQMLTGCAATYTSSFSMRCVMSSLTSTTGGDHPILRSQGSIGSLAERISGMGCQMEAMTGTLWPQARSLESR